MTRKIPSPTRQKDKKIIDKVEFVENSNMLSVNFSKFHLTPICINNQFNNHFKDEAHYLKVLTSFLSIILPKITSHSYNEISETTSEGRQLHLHTIDDTHRTIVKNVLKEYKFTDAIIDQIFEGNCLYEFSASLGHDYPARIVCQKVENTLYFLFFDTNHHIYINKKFINESLFYETCPKFKEHTCIYMPDDCLAVSYLDEVKLKNSFGYTFDPQKKIIR